jgi:hypothetical protein
MGFRGQWKNKRDANEPEIVATLRAHGFCVIHLDQPVDLLIGKGGKTWVAEVKTPKGKLTAAQVAFYETWHGNHLVLRSTQDASDFAAHITKETT